VGRVDMPVIELSRYAPGTICQINKLWIDIRETEKKLKSSMKKSDLSIDGRRLGDL
jgi:hypothetical protein